MSGGEVRGEEIYEALFDDEAFANLPDLLSRAGGGRSSFISWRHADGGIDLLAYNYYTPEFMALYATRFAAIDPWAVFAAQSRIVNTFLPLDRYVPPSVFETSEMKRDFIVQQGDDTGWCAGASFEAPWGKGVVGVHRARRDAAFAEEDIGRLNACAPHLRQLLQVRGELAAHRRDVAISRACLDTVALAAIVVRAGGRLSRLNATGERIVRRADGLAVKDGLLACRDQGSSARLGAAIAVATAAREATGGAVVVKRGGSLSPIWSP